MKKVLPFIFTTVLVLSACSNSKQDGGKVANNSKIEFEQTIIDFGKIAYESDGTCDFKFSNTSDEALIINSVKTTCGCTNPEWPKEPIQPGKTGEIKVKDNTKLQGVFQKSITVFCNAVNSPVKLRIKGEVLPDPAIASTSSKK